MTDRRTGRPVPPADEAARRRIVAERERNVVMDAGAGTGKTTTLVERLVELVAPRGPGRPLPLGRVAAITFTRRAAGELRLRIRGRLLQELATGGGTARRRELLEHAIGDLDGAPIGTIHGFADRLLRMRPVEAGISPSYRVLEEADALYRETADVLRLAACAGTLPDLVAGTGRREAGEAQSAVRDAIEAGVRTDTEEWDGGGRKTGLDAWVRQVILRRDLPFPAVQIPSPDPDAVRRAALTFSREASDAREDGPGARWIRRLGYHLERAADVRETVPLLRALRRAAYPEPDYTMARHFPGDPEGWSLWTRWTKGAGKREAKRGQDPTPVRDRVLGPLEGWLGARIAAAAPTVCRVYEIAKARHEAVDPTDLLLSLRDLLRKNEDGVRSFYQGLFDHILVDEFQDTDPLQAQILFFLCERGATAREWTQVRLAPGRLTVVGDPKQSIYRFRRADVATYATARQVMAGQGALVERLEVNFRSRPALVDFFNDRFARSLGTAPEGAPPFDPATGKTYYEPMRAGVPEAGRPGAAGPAVRVLSYQGERGEALRAKEGRPVEAEALARALHALREDGLAVRDEEAPGGERPVCYGDMAVVARTGSEIPVLFEAFERFGIPYAARGAALFLREPAVRQFLLGLRAIADPSDGPAQAALHRPPFFALDPSDVAAGRCLDGGTCPEGWIEAARRSKEADHLIDGLRRDRLCVPPAATARALLERTAFARTVALLPNGAQRLDAAREVVLLVDRFAAEEGLDFDAATERLREWVEEPDPIDPPAPIGRDAVSVLTIHQAKGLEFPVVAVWDGFHAGRDVPLPWITNEEGNEWGIRLHEFAAASPGAVALQAREKAYGKEEGSRLLYVAATRARDLLILPRPHARKKGSSVSVLLQDLPDGLAEHPETFRPDAVPSWAAAARRAPAFPEFLADPAIERQDAERESAWRGSRDEATRPRTSPVGVTTLAAREVGAPGAPARPGAAPDPEEPDLTDEREARTREIRERGFGPAFGLAVHRTLELLLRGAAASREDVSRACAAACGQASLYDKVAADVHMALRVLDDKGVGMRAPGVTLHPEFPVSLPYEEGRMAIGYVDLLAVSPAATWMVDFKTDTPPGAATPDAVREAYPEYVRQLGIYRDLVARAYPRLPAPRAALLFTGAGAWVPL